MRTHNLKLLEINRVFLFRFSLRIKRIFWHKKKMLALELFCILSPHKPSITWYNNRHVNGANHSLITFVLQTSFTLPSTLYCLIKHTGSNQEGAANMYCNNTWPSEAHYTNGFCWMLMRLHVVRPARHLRGQALPVTARGAQPGAGLLRPVQPPGQAGLEQAGHPHWPVEGDPPGDRGRHGVDSQQTGQSGNIFSNYMWSFFIVTLCGPSL